MVPGSIPGGRTCPLRLLSTVELQGGEVTGRCYVHVIGSSVEPDFLVPALNRWLVGHEIDHGQNAHSANRAWTGAGRWEWGHCPLQPSLASFVMILAKGSKLAAWQSGYSSVGRASDCRYLAVIRWSLVRFWVAGLALSAYPFNA